MMAVVYIVCTFACIVAFLAFGAISIEAMSRGRYTVSAIAILLALASMWGIDASMDKTADQFREAGNVSV